MIILHGAVLDEGLFLWGEAPATDDPKAARSGSRDSKRNGAARYPYDAGAETLEAVLDEAPVAIERAPERLAVALAWLPSRADQPVASSAVVSEPPASRAKPRLAAWKVEGLLLRPAESLELLSALAGRSAALPGVIPGRDLLYWTLAVRMAGSLVVRQHYLPGLVEREGRYLSRWQPVWLDGDGERLAEAGRSMPPVARALTRLEAKKPPQTASVLVLESFIETLVDEIVRSRPPEASFRRATQIGEQPSVAPGAASLALHDRWLQALRGRDAELQGDDKELAQLAEQVREWRRPIDAASHAPFRLCFRLEEPPPAKPEPRSRQRRGRNGRGRSRRESVRPGQRRWYVRYLLQGRGQGGDEHLLVPTADAWITRGRKAAAISRLGTDIHAGLLAAMGQAAGLSHQIEASLRSRKPSGFSLDARGAHEFLTVTAPALEQAGFGVMLPEWWTGHGTRQRLAVRARVRTPAAEELEDAEISLDQKVDFDWQVTLGGKALSGRDLEELARLKEPLVEVRGQWVDTGTEEIHAALEFWKKRQGGKVTAKEIVRMALGAADTSAGIRFEGVRATGWMGDLLTRLQDKGALEKLESPAGFVGTLRPYQARGYDWLAYLEQWGLGACLADDMGLGKTIQTLALMQRNRELGEQRPVLLVCPTSVLTNWQREAARFTPELAVAVHHGAGRARNSEFAELAASHGLVLTSYSLVHRDLETLARVRWAGVVLDEAQNIKNPATKQSQAVRALDTDYRIALTGTPVENHVGDLWSIMDFLNPGFLGDQAQFKRNFFVPIQAYHDREASERLHHVSAPFILRRLKTDKSIIADLPDKLEMRVFCTLTREQGTLYETVVKDAEKTLEEAEGIERKGVILATLTKLKQVCNHPANLLGDGSRLRDRSGKLARLSEMLEEAIEAGDRALVFTQFAEMGHLLQRHLQDTLSREVIFLHGGVAKRSRDAMVERFQSGTADAPPVFVLSLKAGGVGLNLTEANHVFHFDRWWNPAVENQATDRAFRIGQTRNVQVHKFVCAGTLEERIDEMIESKKSLAENIVGTGEGWITELSNEELSDIFALREDAVRG